MKTTEEIKLDIIKYIEETSKHIFEYSIRSGYKGVYSDQKSFFVVKLSEDKENIFVLHKNNVTSININREISYHGQNTKNVISHKLFLVTTYCAKRMVAIKHTNQNTDAINEIFKAYLDDLVKKIETEKNDSIRRAKEAEERAKLAAEQRYKQEYELYLSLKAKFDPEFDVTRY